MEGAEAFRIPLDPFLLRMSCTNAKTLRDPSPSIPLGTREETNWHESAAYGRRIVSARET